MKHLRLMLVLAFAAVLELGLPACTTPVFRYALERWEPSPYSLLVFHRGSLPPAVAQGLAAFRLAARQANLEIIPVELASNLPPAVQQVWLRHTNAALPWAVLRYPASEAETPDAWAGPLQPEVPIRLLDSPARQEIVRRFAAGQAAVWLLLECGKPAEDQAAAALLAAQLTKAARTIEIPPDPDSDQTNQVSLKAEYSLLRIPRQAPAEDLLIQTLLAVDASLAARSTPILVPVFGRGRAMCALPGAQIKADTIAEIADFLTGACSCEVKELNPGVDILMAADWAAAVSGPRVTDPAPAPLPSLGAAVAPATNAVVPRLSAEANSPKQLWQNLLGIAAGLILALLAATLILARARKG